MKRTLAIAALLMLLIATVGTTAVSAWQPPKSPIYTFGVKSDATNSIVGSIVVNTKNAAAPTYLFAGSHLKPGTT